MTLYSCDTDFGIHNVIACVTWSRRTRDLCIRFAFKTGCDIKEATVEAVQQLLPSSQNISTFILFQKNYFSTFMSRAHIVSYPRTKQLTTNTKMLFDTLQIVLNL
jgi:hypothetical protein